MSNSLQKTEHKEWVKVARNLNQLRAGFRKLQKEINYLNRSKGFEGVSKRLKTARRNLRDRYKKEYPEKSDLILFDNSGGLDLVLEHSGHISPKHSFSEKFEDDYDFEVVSTVPENFSDVSDVSIKLEPDNPSHWEDLSMDKWREIADVVDVIRDSCSYLTTGGGHNLPKNSFNQHTLYNSVSRLRSDLEEQMFEEHGSAASTQVFYGGS